MNIQSEALPQNIKKVAILIDWENLRKTLDRAIKKYKIKKKDFTYNDPDKLLQFIKYSVCNDEEIYRIFFYLSEPIKEARWHGQLYSINNNEKYKKVYENSINFIDNIKIKDFVSIRRGKLEFRGYDQQKNPIFTQKQVDMLIGLDIAHLSYLRLVDRVILFSLDTDLIPAVKVARVNGIQIVIPNYPDIRNASYDIQEHADFVRLLNVKEIIDFINQSNE